MSKVRKLIAARKYRPASRDPLPDVEVVEGEATSETIPSNAGAALNVLERLWTLRNTPDAPASFEALRIYLSRQHRKARGI